MCIRHWEQNTYRTCNLVGKRQQQKSMRSSKARRRRPGAELGSQGSRLRGPPWNRQQGRASGPAWALQKQGWRQKHKCEDFMGIVNSERGGLGEEGEPVWRRIIKLAAEPRGDQFHRSAEGRKWGNWRDDLSISLSPFWFDVYPMGH